MSGGATTPPAFSPPGAGWRWLLRGLSAAAAGVTGFLLQLSLANRGLPPGCGAGSGCEEVLTSRWSVALGVPVSGPALLLYLVILAASIFIAPAHSVGKQRAAWTALVLLAAAICTAAAWFVVLQFFVLRAVCPWCMADHTLGLMIAGMIFWRAPFGKMWGTKGKDCQAEMVSDGPDCKSGLQGERQDRPWRGRGGVLAGGGLVAGMIAAQWLFEYHPPQIQRLPIGKNADTGPGPERWISVLNGNLQIAPHIEPRLGSPDAPKLVVVLFDYCCPHCRATHGYLLTGLDRYQGQMGVVVLPMPLDGKCNPGVTHTEPRFEHACELARLALAVWKADPRAFPAFDAWLFEPEMPRDPQQARAQAESLVTAAALARALSDPWVDKQIARHVKAYSESGAERIPVLMSPGFASIVGRPESEQELFDVLEKELLLTPPAPRAGKTESK